MAISTGYKPKPLHIILEIVGTTVAGLGIAEVFANTNLVPAQFQFENYGWLMIIGGFLLNIPHVHGLIKHAKHS